MQTAQMKFCENCDVLYDMYSQLECSILQFSKNKWTNQSYNTDLYFDLDHFRDLLRLKRIVQKRLQNQNYPCDRWTTQDLVGYIVKNLYKSHSCIPCPCKEFTNFLETSTTSTTSTSTTFPFIPPTPPSTSTTTTLLPPITSTTTTLPEPTQPSIDCGEQGAFAGGQVFPSVIEVILGTDIGLVTLDFNAFNIPDKFIVRFDGEEVINTGYRGSSSYQAALDANLATRGLAPETIDGTGIGNSSFNKTTTTSSAFVYVYAPLPNTAWNFTLNCPQ